MDSDSQEHIHVFQFAHGSCFGEGNVSNHGYCAICKITMNQYGHVDKEGNITLTTQSIDGKFNYTETIKHEDRK